jgi:hypothetical protein
VVCSRVRRRSFFPRPLEVLLRTADSLKLSLSLLHWLSRRCQSATSAVEGLWGFAKGQSHFAVLHAVHPFQRSEIARAGGLGAVRSSIRCRHAFGRSLR